MIRLSAVLVLFMLTQCKPATIHPTVHATNNEELTQGFMNGLEFNCPEGTTIHWATKTPPQSRSYSAIINDIEAAECR